MATKSPFTRDEFHAKAKPVVVKIDNVERTLHPRDFSTGSFGFGTNEKITLNIDGVPTLCTVNLNVVVVGSKRS